MYLAIKYILFKPNPVSVSGRSINPELRVIRFDDHFLLPYSITQYKLSVYSTISARFGIRFLSRHRILYDSSSGIAARIELTDFQVVREGPSCENTLDSKTRAMDLSLSVLLMSWCDHGRLLPLIKSMH